MSVLVKITTQYVDSTNERLTISGENLDQIKPEQVFKLRYQQQYNEAPSTEYITAFNELLVKSYDND